MIWWEAALWALAGGFVAEGLEFAALQRRHRKWPWQVDAEASTDESDVGSGVLGSFVGEALRLAAGCILGAALAGQVTGPLPALAIGATAPVVAGNLLTFVPLQSEASGTAVVATAATADVTRGHENSPAAVEGVS